MTIPIICISKSLVELPFMYMVFGQQLYFYLAIGGIYCEYFFAKGWTSSAILILSRVVDPEISYLGINTFIVLSVLNNAVTPIVIHLILGKTLGFATGDAHISKTAGFYVLIALCVPLVICCPFFWVAGKTMVKKQQTAVNEGKENKSLQR